MRSCYRKARLAEGPGPGGIPLSPLRADPADLFELFCLIKVVEDEFRILNIRPVSVYIWVMFVYIVHVYAQMCCMIYLVFLMEAARKDSQTPPGRHSSVVEVSDMSSLSDSLLSVFGYELAQCSFSLRFESRVMNSSIINATQNCYYYSRNKHENASGIGSVVLLTAKKLTQQETKLILLLIHYKVQKYGSNIFSNLITCSFLQEVRIRKRKPKTRRRRRRKIQWTPSILRRWPASSWC